MSHSRDRNPINPTVHMASLVKQAHSKSSPITSMKLLLSKPLPFKAHSMHTLVNQLRLRHLRSNLNRPSPLLPETTRHTTHLNTTEITTRTSTQDHTVSNQAVFRTKMALLVCNSELPADTAVRRTNLRPSTHRALPSNPSHAMLLQASLKQAATRHLILSLKLSSSSRATLPQSSRVNTNHRVKLADTHMATIHTTQALTMLLTT